MGDVREALSRLDTFLARAGAEVLRVAHPGIGERELVQELAVLELRPTPGLLEWFGWHDGAGEPGMPALVIELAPGCEFYPAATLAQECLNQRRITEEITSGPAIGMSAELLWRRTWFPILRLFGKGYVVTDLALDTVHVVWLDASPEDRARVRWPSLSAFVEELVTRFEEGVYVVDEVGTVRGPTLDYP